MNLNTLAKRLYKFKFNIQHLPYFYAPNAFRNYSTLSIWNTLKPEEKQYVLKRVELCNQMNEPFSLSTEAECLNDLKLKPLSGYKIDFASAIRGFSRQTKFDLLFGDIVDVPSTPSIVKTRPIDKPKVNQNSILLKLNTQRHYQFFNDPYSWNKKSNIPIFRGWAHTEERQNFLINYSDNPATDFRSSYRKGTEKAFYLSPQQQMQHKFILSLEGNDVASNLKWIMASNSLCVMKKPTIESWFLESQLIAGKHYIEINDDLLNVGEAIQPYLDNKSLVQEMLQAKKEYLAPFKNAKMEQLISHLIIEKYVKLSLS